MGKNKFKNNPKTIQTNNKKTKTTFKKKAQENKPNSTSKDKERWKLLFQNAKSSSMVENLETLKPKQMRNQKKVIKQFKIDNLKKHVQPRKPTVMEWIEEDITDEELNESVDYESDDIIESFIDRALENKSNYDNAQSQSIEVKDNSYNEDTDSDWEDIEEDENSEVEDTDSDESSIDDEEYDSGDTNDSLNHYQDVESILKGFKTSNSTKFDSDDECEEEELDDEYFENGYFLSSDDDSSEDENDNGDYDFSDENDDEDYSPPSSDDLYIKRGEAKIYNIDDDNISFPHEYGAQLIEIIENGYNSESSCPELVSTENKVEVSKQPVIKTVLKETSLLQQILSLSTVESEDIVEEEVECDAQEKPIREKAVFNLIKNMKSIEKSTKSKCYTSPVLSDQILLHLKEKISFNGYFNATLVAGNAESCGYEFQLNHKVRIFSPKSQCLIYITPISSSNVNSILLIDSISDSYLLKDLNEIKSNFNENTDALLILENNASQRAECVKTNLRKQIFPDFVKHNTQRLHYKAECILKTFFNFSGEKINKFQIQDEWRDCNIDIKSRTVVMGGKGVGKSHLVRYLINKSLSSYPKVGVIDFDIGQSEIFLPQTVSAAVLSEPLLGHGAFHRIAIKKSIVFGDISVTLEQIKYLQCLREIIRFCQMDEEFKSIPWIVNTMGYTKGLGEEIIVAIIKDIEATNIIQIQSQRASENFSQIITSSYVQNYSFNILTDELGDSHNSINFTTSIVQAYDSNMWHEKHSFNQKDMRLIIILAHLGEILMENDEKSFLDITPKV